jgi:hypothetical protein
MKKLSLGKLKLGSEERLERGQLATIFGGSGSYWNFFQCTCNNGGSYFTLYTDEEPTKDTGCPFPADVQCVLVG